MSLTQITKDRVFLNGRTTDAATPVVLGTYTVPDGYIAQCTAEVNGQKDASTGGIFSVKASVRATGGATTLIGSVLNLITAQLDAGIATAAVTMDVSGATVRVKATGLIATNIDFGGVLDILLFKQ